MSASVANRRDILFFPWLLFAPRAGQTKTRRTSRVRVSPTPNSDDRPGGSLLSVLELSTHSREERESRKEDHADWRCYELIDERYGRSAGGAGSHGLGGPGTRSRASVRGAGG
ncbi:hypothetical protein GCM10027563_31470 [Parasphingorhabdus pacifica]